MSGMGEPGLFGGNEGVPDPSGEAVSPDSLASGFLKNIPETDRPFVEKYVKEWDAGVTRKFQSIHDQYKPYKDLGVDAPTVQRAVQIMQMLNTDPMNFYNLLRAELGDRIPQETPRPQPQPGEQELPPWAEGMNPEFFNRFGRLEQMLTTLAERYLETEKMSEQQKQDAQLENYLGSLRQKHGEFDEQWVLSRMYQGVDGEQAVKEYGQFVKSLVEQHSTRRPAPVVLGNGAHPVGGKSPAEMSSNEVQNLVAQMLAAGQEG